MTNELELKQKMIFVYEYLGTKIRFHIDISDDNDYYLKAFISEKGSIPTKNIFKQVTKNGKMDYEIALNQKNMFESLWLHGDLSEMLNEKNRIVLELTNQINNWINMFNELKEPITETKTINGNKFKFSIYPRKTSYDGDIYPYDLIVEKIPGNKINEIYFKQTNDTSVLDYEISKNHNKEYKSVLFFKNTLNNIFELKERIINDLKNLK